MSLKKKIDKLFCAECESEFRLSYDPDEVSRWPTYCPFCSSELSFDEEEELEEDVDKDDQE